MLFLFLLFTGNPVNTWREVTKLGESFPFLESLVLAECPIKNLDPFYGESVGSLHNFDSSKQLTEPETEMDANSNYKRSESECESSEKKISSHNFFRHLRFLNLNYTLLESWDDVDRLGKFPALHCLRIQGCPLFEVNLPFLIRGNKN